MKNKSYAYLLLAALMTVFFAGCGGGGGSTPAVQPSLSVTSSKSIALNNNLDAITITATFQAPLPADQSVVTFSIASGTATPSALTAKTTNGVAQITVTSATAGKVAIKADYPGSTASTGIKFIVQPNKMDVSVALNPPVTSLSSLQFIVITDHSTYNSDIAAVNEAAKIPVGTPNGIILADAFATDTNNLNVGLGHDPDFDTLSTPILKFSYTVSGGLPNVAVKPNDPNKPPNIPDNIIATINKTLKSIKLTPVNFVLTIKYDTDTF